MGGMTADFEELPSRRRSLRGINREGAVVWLAHSTAAKLYRCPGCGRDLPIGTEHVLVRSLPSQGEARHQHWHSECARATVLPKLKHVDIRPAGEAEGGWTRPSKGARRAAALRRRTDRGRY
jgi:hypothetical protein